MGGIVDGAGGEEGAVEPVQAPGGEFRPDALGAEWRRGFEAEWGLEEEVQDGPEDVRVPGEEEAPALRQPPVRQPLPLPLTCTLSPVEGDQGKGKGGSGGDRWRG